MDFKYSSDYVPYEDAVHYMENHVAKIINKEAQEQIWFLEHDNLLTAGVSAHPSELLKPDLFPVYQAGRGGKYTYHGPGIRVVYFMLDLNTQKTIGKDVRKFVCKLEQVIIDTLAYFGIRGERRKDRVGIWVENNSVLQKESKIAAIGIRLRKWVSFHGIAVNINPNLDNFNAIVPCGINPDDYGVTSMWSLGKKVTMQEFDEILKKELLKIFA